MNEYRANPVLRKLTSCLCLTLIAALWLYPIPVLAQVHAAPPKGLQIMILSGEGALNNIEARTAREPIVEVQDQNHKPVAGAAVLFTIHSGHNGAGGSFQNNSSTYSTVTNANGIATASGFHPNQTEGSYQISVSANIGSLTASSVINEINIKMSPVQKASNTQSAVSGLRHALHPHFSWLFTKPALLIGGGVVLGTVIGVIVATRPTSPTQITPGATKVGAPAARPATGITFRF